MDAIRVHWKVLEAYVGEREATFEHFQQGGNSAAFGGWLNYKFEPDKPTFAEMGVAEWEWIKRQTCY